jgi:thiamine biosynthesis lipoprotein
MPNVSLGNAQDGANVNQPEYSFSTSACGQGLTISYPAFNTWVEITVYPAQPFDCTAASHALQNQSASSNANCASTQFAPNIHVSECVTRCLHCFSLCQKYEGLFSRTIPTSDIARVNKAAGQPCKISPQTANLLQAAINYCEYSAGSFDITIGSAIKLWNFKAGTVPNTAALSEAIKHVDFHALNVFKRNDSWFAQLSDSAAMIDLGGIAKGWIADQLADYLRSCTNIKGALINLGGNIVVTGQKPNNAPFNIGIKNPFDLQTNIGHVQLDCKNRKQLSMVTSGVYERSFEHNGQTFHHILNPKTGMPHQTNIQSATILCEKSIDAEGFSTTFLMLGPQNARKLAKSHPEILQAYFVDNSGVASTLK